MQSVKKVEIKEVKEGKDNKQRGGSKKKKEKKTYRDRNDLDSTPVAYGKKAGVSRPVINNMGRMCIVKHREFVGEVLGSPTFSVRHHFNLNPGMVVSFPWLSKMANNWEQYSFRNLLYEYIPRCSTLTSGSIMMVPDYDALDSAPTSKSVALTYANSVEDSSWKRVTCNLKRESLQPIGPKKYIRDSNVAGDLKTYDGGNMFICVQGQADQNAIGDLWVSYEVHLFVPQTEIVPGATRANNYYRENPVAVPIGASTLSFPSQKGNPLRIGVVNNETFTPPKGTYLILFTGTFGGGGGTEISCSISYFINGVFHQNTQVVQETYSSTPDAFPEITLATSHIYTFNGTDNIEVHVVVLGAVTAPFFRAGQLIFLVV